MVSGKTLDEIQVYCERPAGAPSPTRGTVPDLDSFLERRSGDAVRREKDDCCWWQSCCSRASTDGSELIVALEREPQRHIVIEIEDGEGDLPRTPRAVESSDSQGHAGVDGMDRDWEIRPMAGVPLPALPPSSEQDAAGP